MSKARHVSAHAGSQTQIHAGHRCQRTVGQGCQHHGCGFQTPSNSDWSWLLALFAQDPQGSLLTAVSCVCLSPHDFEDVAQGALELSPVATMGPGFKYWTLPWNASQQTLTLQLRLLYYIRVTHQLWLKKATLEAESPPSLKITATVGPILSPAALLQILLQSFCSQQLEQWSWH